MPLQKRKTYFQGKKYVVKISKPGYEDQVVTVDTNVNLWYVGGNFIFGGLVGWLIVNPATGAMWSLDTNEINASLTARTTMLEPDGAAVVLLQDVPAELRSKMVRVAQ